MQKYFDIRPSTAQLVLLLLGHGLAGLVMAIYIEPAPMTLAAVALTGLLALRESRVLMRQGYARLKPDPRGESIEFEQAGQPYFYYKYKVYATRWFAILRLIDKHQNRTLILNPDRFESIQSYRQLRYVLLSMERASVA
ncbi:MAG: hypothetical protein OEO19_11615 [Gammaproteobacteria bacterium]|nr:hypothetical protein [Gammaproteobacteria bacterium]MDH3446828.1 hypothetical protein [Gammaproteobacteria bacterium]